MATHKVIDGPVPGAPVGLQVGAIPPVSVEVAIAEHGEFGQGVHVGVEEGEEAGEPDDERDGGELHQAFDDGGQIQHGHLVEGVAEERGRVLCRGQPDEDGEADNFEGSFQHEDDADVAGAGVDGLVDQGGGPPEVGEVLKGDVLRVGALQVHLWQEAWGCWVEHGVAKVAVREGI